MLTGELRSQIDRIWDAFWTGGISNPLEVMEQLTYLLFIKRLDELHTGRERKANRLGQALTDPIFPSGATERGRPCADLRWSRFKHFDPATMFAVVSDEVFPFIRTLRGDLEESAYARHMRDARFTIPTPALLARVVDLLDKVPMEDRDTKGDVYESMLGKIATAGQSGQFRTPRHIIRMMVELVQPPPSDHICYPACSTPGFLVAAGEGRDEGAGRPHGNVIKDKAFALAVDYPNGDDASMVRMSTQEEAREVSMVACSVPFTLR